MSVLPPLVVSVSVFPLNVPVRRGSRLVSTSNTTAPVDGSYVQLPKSF